MQNIAMFSKHGILLSLLVGFVASEDISFTFNGFRSANLSLDGIAEITANGLLKLTNDTKQQTGHAFYPNPISFKNSLNGNPSSFSTTFVFSIISQYSTLSGHGITFVIAPTKGIPEALPSQYLGLFNETNNGNSNNHVVAIELDTIQSREFADINDNHVGIDINGLKSEKSAPAGYFADNNGGFKDMSLISGHQMQVWVDYDGVGKQINVILAPINVDKPKIPLLSMSLDLSPVINDNMYVGFSSSTGSVLSDHYVLGWSFKMNGQAEAPALVLSQLPKLPRIGGKKRSKLLTIGLPMMIVSLVSVAISAAVFVVKRKRKFAELVEDWELDYEPLVALDSIEFYGNHTIGEITIVGVIEKAKVLAWKCSRDPSCWSNHESNPMTTQSGILGNDGEHKSRREGRRVTI